MRHFVIFVLLFLSGCVVQQATINSYVDPAFQPGTIQRVAVFPIRNARMAPGESEQINRKFTQALLEKNPNVHIIGASEAVRALNENEMADDWAIFLDNYLTSGIPDGSLLGQIGDAVEADAILQGELVNIFQEDGQYGGNAGQTRVTVRFSMLDTRSGKLSWEASSDGIKKTATTLESAPSILDAVNLAVDKILTTLPNL